MSIQFRDFEPERTIPMARSILSLFARSPWGAIQEHARHATECVELLDPLMDAVLSGDHNQTFEIAAKISKAENAADEVKNTLRDHLPRSIFLPVAREDLLDILHVQDGIADAAEDVGVVSTMRSMESQPKLVQPIKNLVKVSTEACTQYAAIVQQLDSLVEASFTGAEATRVMKMIHEVARLEHEADLAQAEASRTLFEIDTEVGMRAGALYVWIGILQSLGDVSNKAEKAANRLRMFLAT